MTNKKQPEALRLAEMLTADEWPGSVTLVSYAQECVTELLRQHAENETLRAGYAAARLEIESLKALAAPATAQSADSVPAVSDLPPLPAPDLRDVGTKPQEIKEFLKGYATEYARTAIAARAPADSVQEDAALWRWLAEYLVGTRTDLDDEIAASETVNDLRKLVEAAIKQGENHDHT